MRFSAQSLCVCVRERELRLDAHISKLRKCLKQHFLVQFLCVYSRYSTLGTVSVEREGKEHSHELIIMSWVVLIFSPVTAPWVNSSYIWASSRCSSIWLFNLSKIIVSYMHCHSVTGDSPFPCCSQNPINQPSDKQTSLNSLKDLLPSMSLFVAVSQENSGTLESILWAFFPCNFWERKDWKTPHFC